MKTLMKAKSEVESGGALVKASAVKVYPKQARDTGDDIGRAIDCYLSGGVGKFGKYVACENALVYRTLSTPNGGARILQDIVSVRLPNGQVLGNSSVLGLIGRTVSFGNERLNRTVSEVQTRLSSLITMIPFNVFTEANLNLNTFRMIDKGPEERVTRKIPNPEHRMYRTAAQKAAPEFIDETVHFTGASLFTVDGKTFLFDLDRRELTHKIFNAFLVAIPGVVATIDQAYEALKPQDVRDAEAKGLKVLRQGEWFFIPVEGEFEPVKARNTQWSNREFEALVLRAGQNRPNTAHRYAILKDKTHVVTGYVEHQGREHAKLILKGWFRAVPNTATESFTITGDVD